MTNEPNLIAGFIELGILFVIGVVIYILPIVVALRRQHPQTGAIAAVTILLGWTFLGWAIALIWALTNPAIIRESAQANKSSLAYIWLDGDDDSKTCPKCAEKIKRAAIVCRYCGVDLN